MPDPVGTITRLVPGNGGTDVTLTFIPKSAPVPAPPVPPPTEALLRLHILHNNYSAIFSLLVAAAVNGVAVQVGVSKLSAIVNPLPEGEVDQDVINYRSYAIGE